MMELPLIELGKAGRGGNFDEKNQKLSVGPCSFFITVLIQNFVSFSLPLAFPQG